MIRFVVVVLLSLSIGQVSAADIHIVLSDAADSYKKISHQLVTTIKTKGVNLTPKVSSLTNFNLQKTTSDDLIITIGNEAANSLAAVHQSRAVIYGFVDQQMLPNKGNWIATVTSQPISRLNDAVSPLLNQSYKKRLLVAVSDDNQILLKQLKNTQTEQLDVVHIPSNQKPAKYIEDKLYNAGALIASHDHHIWSGENARWMLYQAYRYKVPVVGYSQKFLKAGALVSVYSTSQQITSTTAEQVLYWVNNQRLSKSGLLYSDYNIEYNQNIARALKITVPKAQLNVSADQ